MDDSSDPQTYTHGYDPAVQRSHRWRTAANSAGYLIDHLRPGMDLLDVGCGVGTITWDLARLVAPGRVIGIDVDDGVLDAARAAAPPDVTTVELRIGDVGDLDLPDQSVDVVHAHQVLQHLGDPVAALREMRRVCRPGGIVAVRDVDYESMTWWPHSQELTRWLEVYRQVHRANGSEPDAGRRLLGWAQQAGFEQVEAGASAWAFATPGDRRWWADTWAERTTATRFADHALRHGVTTRAELDEIAVAWRAWADEPDGWFAMIHAELICRL